MFEIRKYEKRLIAVILAIIMSMLLIGTILLVFRSDEPQSPVMAETPCGEIAVTEGEGSGDHVVSLAAVKLEEPQQELQDVPMPTAATATSYLLTASVKSSQTLRSTTFDWSVEFAQSNSWSTGKTASDYVKVTPSSDGAATATVTCSAAFGAQIRVKASLREFPGKFATCNVDSLSKGLQKLRFAKNIWTLQENETIKVWVDMHAGKTDYTEHSRTETTYIITGYNGEDIYTIAEQYDWTITIASEPILSTTHDSYHCDYDKYITKSNIFNEPYTNFDYHFFEKLGFYRTEYIGGSMSGPAKYPISDAIKKLDYPWSNANIKILTNQPLLTLEITGIGKKTKIVYKYGCEIYLNEEIIRH